MRFLITLLPLLILCGAATAQERRVPGRSSRHGQGLALPLSIDMGKLQARPGAIVCRSASRNEGFAWFGGMVRDGYDATEKDPWLCDYIAGEDATFLLAVEPAEGIYRLQLTLGDPGAARGPVSVVVNDIPFLSGIESGAGECRQVDLETETRDGWIEVRFVAEGCQGFALNGIVVEGPPGARLGALFPRPALKVAVPPPDQLTPLDRAGAEALLRELADYLLAMAPREGGFSYHGAWYQNAYPVRTLIEAGRLLDEPRYTAAAVACLDWFVASQGRDGNWLATYVASAACHSDASADSSSANLADIGAMSTCLSLVAPHVDKDRRKRYLRAAEKYADRIVLPGQRPDGSFRNGRFGGSHFEHPYTVATACQTASLAALYEATGKKRFLQAAERGAGWLSENTILDDGRVSFHPHNSADVQVLESTNFGNMFYVAEAMVIARAATRDDSLRTAIDAMMDRWFYAPAGLEARSEHGYWWSPRDPWGSSKMGGMLYILAHLPRRPGRHLDQWIQYATDWLANPALRQTIGVTRHPARSGGEYALAATGFAGIGVAAIVEQRRLPEAVPSIEGDSTVQPVGLPVMTPDK